MKTYTQLLDLFIVSLLILAVQFHLSDDSIINSTTSRAGLTRTMIISWQSLMVVASFCLLLRYIARNVRS